MSTPSIDDVLAELAELRATVDAQARRIGELEMTTSRPGPGPVPTPATAAAQSPETTPAAASTPPDSTDLRGVSRRRLFGVAAAGVAGAAGTLVVRPDVAAAADGAPLTLGAANDSQTSTTWTRTTNATPPPTTAADPMLRMDTPTAFVHSTGLEIELRGRGDAIRVIHGGPSDTPSDTGSGIDVTMTSTSNIKPGVGVTSAGAANAIEGAITNNAQGLAGVFGHTNGVGFGVHGKSEFRDPDPQPGDPADEDNETGAAVFGETDSSNIAVLGDNSGPAGTGVFGRALATDGSAVALRGDQAGLGAGAIVDIRNADNGEAVVVATTDGVGAGITVDLSNADNDQAAIVATTAGDGPGLDVNASGTGPAIDASSAKGIGVVAAGKLAPLRLVPPSSTTVGSPTTGAHLKGEVFLDTDGAVFVCVKSGSPGTWSALNVGAGTSGGGGGGGGSGPPDVRSFGLQLLGTANRAFDSRSGRAPTGGGAGPKGVIQPGTIGARTIDLRAAGGVPASAPAALVNLTVTETTNTGYVSIYAADIKGTPKTSSINWSASNQNIANTTVVALSSGKIKAYSANPTHVIIDVIGYYL